MCGDPRNYKYNITGWNRAKRCAGNLETINIILQGELELKDVWGTLKLETDIQQTLSCLLTLGNKLWNNSLEGASQISLF